MKKNTYIIVLFLFLISCESREKYNDGYISYKEEVLSESQKERVAANLMSLHERYDPKEQMLTQKLTGWNYHTDADSGIYHDVRASLYYAIDLLRLNKEEYTQRAFDIVKKVISLQDTITSSPSCGVWPYFMEEPLATKKSPIDYNWADFNAVSLLEIVLKYGKRIPVDLMPEIKNAIILAARAIEKRNMGPHYTNIAIMGTYVTYMAAHLENLPDLKKYAEDRLNCFYQYTLDKGGFSEYNSPTYTMVALDELNKMKLHIVEPEAKQKIDSLYAIGWDIIARHYHVPTGQWVGPHSRSYSTLIGCSFYDYIKQASDGTIRLMSGLSDDKPIVAHQIPTYLYPYFMAPVYPRTEVDVFENEDPKIIGVSYLTDTYAISSVNRSCMWNQRRPLSAYWGTIEKPCYLQVRMLHEFFDFSAGTIYTAQKENSVLAAMNFSTNGGDKHVSIDPLKDGKFHAKDLRLRFELGNCCNIDEIELPIKDKESFSFKIGGVQLAIQLYKFSFGGMKGYWEKGKDDKNSWVDYVLYAGSGKDFDLQSMNDASLGFSVSIGLSDEKLRSEPVVVSQQGNQMDANWKGLSVSISVKPTTNAKNI